MAVDVAIQSLIAPIEEQRVVTIAYEEDLPGWLDYKLPEPFERRGID